MRYLLVILFLGIGCFFIDPSMICAQRITHTVEKGDTLWSICEKHYGDPDLWPKLWQMNQFITNPHILNIGDVITLFEKKPVKKTEVPKEEKKPPVKKTEELKPKITGIDVSNLTRIDSLGYLSRTQIETWGRLFSSKSGKIIFSEGDTVFVIFNQGKEVNPGDEFAICQTSPMLKHPVTGKDFGYTLSIHGKLVIEEPSGYEYTEEDQLQRKKQSYKAKILEVYKTVQINDLVIPHESVSPCVQPVSIKQELLGNIVAAKDQLQLMSQYSVLYIDRGFNHGVQRGNLFEVVKTNIIPDPENKNPWIDKKMILPDVVIGVIMVLESRPDTATAIVLSVKESISRGAYIKDMFWEERPESLSLMTSCVIE